YIGNVIDVRIQVRVRAHQMRTLTQSGERGREHLVTVGAYLTRDGCERPSSGPASVNEHNVDHSSRMRLDENRSQPAATSDTTDRSAFALERTQGRPRPEQPRPWV